MKKLLFSLLFLPSIVFANPQIGGNDSVLNPLTGEFDAVGISATNPTFTGTATFNGSGSGFILDGSTFTSTSLGTACAFMVIASSDGTNASLLNQTDNFRFPATTQITSFQADFFSSTGPVSGTGTIVYSSCTAANYPNFGSAIATMVFSNAYSTSTACNQTFQAGDYVQAKRTAVGGGPTNMSRHYGLGIKLP